MLILVQAVYASLDALEVQFNVGCYPYKLLLSIVALIKVQFMYRYHSKYQWNSLNNHRMGPLK